MFWSDSGWQKALLYREAPLNDLRDKLAAPLFQGVPIGYTLNDLLIIYFFSGNLRWNLKEMLLSRLRYRYHWWQGIRLTPQPLPRKTGCFLLTWLNRRQHLRDMVLPLVQSLGPAQCVIIGGDPSMSSQLPADTGFLTWKGVPAFDFQRWRRQYKNCAPAWHQQLKTWIRQHGVPEGVFFYLADAILVQSQMIMAYGELLDRLRPKAVITEYDQNTQASCLILAAKARGIPTMTMIHGMISAVFGYTPVLADLAFCWGKDSYEKLLQAGTEAERLVIVGCQQLSRSVNASPEAAKAKVGLPRSLPLVLLATNPIFPEYRRKLVRVFCEGMAGYALASGAIRLHPSEKLDFYAPEIDAFPRIKFLDNETWTLDEAMAAADMVVCHNSGLGTDALIKGKLTVILDVLPMPLFIGEELIEKAGCPRAQSAGELTGIISRILSDRGYHQRLKDNVERYVKDFCTTFGEDAANNIAQIIVAKIK